MSDQTSEIIKLATILPVQRSTRTETVIIMVSNDWNELVDLCHDPRAYLKSQQFAYDRLSDEYIEWELFSPAALTLKCGGKDPLLASRTASLLPKGTQMGDKVTSIRDAGNATAKALADAMAGLFHVEFATYTSYVNVIYYPLNQALDPGGPIAYKNEFTDPVLLATSNDTGAASFHTDIDSSPRARGQLAASIAQDPNWFLGKLSALPAKTVTGKLSPVTEPIKKGSGPDTAAPLGPKLQLADGGDYAKYLDLVLTGLSNPVGGTNNCLATELVPDGKGGYIIVCTSFVVYDHAAFETQEVIRRTVTEIDAEKAKEAAAAKGKAAVTGGVAVPTTPPSAPGG